MLEGKGHYSYSVLTWLANRGLCVELTESFSYAFEVPSTRGNNNSVPSVEFTNTSIGRRDKATVLLFFCVCNCYAHTTTPPKILPMQQTFIDVTKNKFSITVPRQHSCESREGFRRKHTNKGKKLNDLRHTDDVERLCPLLYIAGDALSVEIPIFASSFSFLFRKSFVLLVLHLFFVFLAVYLRLRHVAVSSRTVIADVSQSQADENDGTLERCYVTLYSFFLFLFILAFCSTRF